VGDNFTRVVNNAYVLFNGPDGGNADYAGGAAYDPNNGSYAQKVLTAA